MAYDFSDQTSPETYEGSAKPYEFSWLNRNTVNQNTKDMYEEWFRNDIKINGIQVRYARTNADFAKSITDPDGNIDWAQINFDPIYMEKPDQEFYDWGPLQVKFENSADSFLYDKLLGASRQSSGKIFILKRDFYEQFRYVLGTDETENYTMTVAIPDVVPDVFSGNVETVPWAFDYTFSGEDLTPESIADTFTFLSTPRHYNITAAWSRTYPAVSDLAVVVKNVEISESAQTISINIDVSYKGRWYPNSANLYQWPLAPKVKDFFVIKVGDRFEKYEVTLITDQDFQQDGMNTFLYDYVWRCDVVRMSASFEVGTDTAQSPTEMDLQKLIDESANKETTDSGGGQQNPFYGEDSSPDDWNRSVLGN